MRSTEALTHACPPLLLPPCPQVLASAVAKLYLCPAGSPSFAWTGLWGACVLVVDRSRSNPSKHIQLWSLHPSSSAAAAAAAAAGSTADSVSPPTLDRTLNVQLYEGLDYLSLHPLFHAFEVDSGVVGLSFGHVAEAAEFAAKCREHVPAAGSTPRAPPRKASLLQRISGIFSSASPSATAAGASTPPPSGSPKDYSGPSSGSLSPLIGGPGSSSGGNHTTAASTGSGGNGGGPSISPPQGFVHHAHAGFSPAGHFVPGGNLPIEWHGLFENAQQAIAIKNAARERGNSQNSSSSSTPGAAAFAAAAAAAPGGSVQGSPASAHSEGSPTTSHPHHRQLSHHAAWAPAHNPNQSPKA